MDRITAKTPWEANMGEVPMHLSYFRGTLFEAVARTAQRYPDHIAFDFMGKSTSYAQFIELIHACAKSLKALGIRENDKLTIAMPNCPQSITLFYAVNMIGGIANMIHPLSAEKEITFYLKESDSVAVVTLDQFYEKMIRAGRGTNTKHLILASIQDALPMVKKIGFAFTKGRKMPKVASEGPVIRWKEFLAMGAGVDAYRIDHKAEDPAVILYSGGTTGTTKGVVLSNLNFNALGQQIIATNPMFRPGDKMLAAMPIFHGFGLGVSIHSTKL